MTTEYARLLAGQVYEYRKGVRRLCMMTWPADQVDRAAVTLQAERIAFHIQRINHCKVNLFFGHPAYLETVRALVCKPLYRLTPEEDFILGTLLGYDGEQQCRRYLERQGRPAECNVVPIHPTPAVAAE